MAQSLPEGFVIRPPVWEDLEGVIEIIHMCDRLENGAPDLSIEDIRRDWQQHDFNRETDAWVVLSPEGRYAAYGSIWRIKTPIVESAANVHPDFTGRGIAAYLLQNIERRMQAYADTLPPSTPLSLQNWCSTSNQVAAQLLEQRGYRVVRYFWTMGITLDSVIPAPQWPENIRLRTFRLGDDNRVLYEAYEEAFGDHWGHIYRPFEEWQERRLLSQTIETDLWFLAMDGNEIAGYALCENWPENGLVDLLGVRKAWRKSGLGLALLHHTFSEFQRRGVPLVKLRVDADNQTGAVRLYERAGMSVTARFSLYQKEIATGEKP